MNTKCVAIGVMPARSPEALLPKRMSCEKVRKASQPSLREDAKMTKRKEVHITPRDDNKWAVKKPENERATALTDTKKEAIEIAKEIAKREGREMIPHNKDGKISNPNSYGKDPCPPKDKKK